MQDVPSIGTSRRKGSSRRRIAALLLLLFGFPLVFQFYHAVTRHVVPRCTSACQPHHIHASSDQLKIVDAHGSSGSCEILSYKASIKEVPSDLVLPQIAVAPANVFFSLLQGMQSFSVFFSSSRAPPALFVFF